MLSEDFTFLVEEFGRPRDAHKLSALELASCKGKLPQSLLDFWSECGIGSWLDGKFQFCNPSDYQSVVQELCRNDADFGDGRSHLIGYTAFGSLYIWHEQQGYLIIDLPVLKATADMTWSKLMNLERKIAARLVYLDGDGPDMLDENAEPLFQRCLKTLGRLQLGECYGFVPALALGGAAKQENIRRLSALEHFTILAGLGRPRLFDYKGGPGVFVREIGA